MKQYLDLLRYVLNNGTESDDRAGIGTLSCFGKRFEHDLNQSFPIITTKKIHWHSVATELLWLLSGKEVGMLFSGFHLIYLVRHY